MKIGEYINFIKYADAEQTSTKDKGNSIALDAPEILNQSLGMDIPKTINIPDTLNGSLPYSFTGDKPIPFTNYKTPPVQVTNQEVTIPAPELNIPTNTTINIPQEFTIGNTKIKLPKAINFNDEQQDIPTTINVNGAQINLPNNFSVTVPALSTVNKGTRITEKPTFSEYTPGYGVFNPQEGRDLFRVITDIPALYAFQHRTDPRGTFANLRGTAYTKPKDPLNAALNWANFGVAFPPFVGPKGEFSYTTGKALSFPVFQQLAMPHYSVGALLRPSIEQAILHNIVQKDPDAFKLSKMFTSTQENDIKKLKRLLDNIGLISDIQHDPSGEELNFGSDILDALNAAYSFNPQINGDFYEWVTRGTTDNAGAVNLAQYGPEALEAVWSIMRPITAAKAVLALSPTSIPAAVSYGSIIAAKEMALWNDFYRSRANMSDMGWKWDPVTATPFLESHDGSTIYYTPATFRMTGSEEYPQSGNPPLIRDPIERSKRNTRSHRTGVLLNDGSYVKAYTPFLDFEGKAKGDPKYFAALRPGYDSNSRFMIMRDAEGNTYPATRPDAYPITALYDNSGKLIQPITEFLGWTGDYTTESDSIALDGERVRKGNKDREYIVTNPQWQNAVRLSIENPEYLDPYIDSIDTLINSIQSQNNTDAFGLLQYLSKVKYSLTNLKYRLLQSYIPPQFVPGQAELLEQYFDAISNKNWYRMSEIRDQLLELRNKGRTAYIESLSPPKVSPPKKPTPRYRSSDDWKDAETTFPGINGRDSLIF